MGVIEPWCVDKDKAPGISGLAWGEIDDERQEGRCARFKIVTHLCQVVAAQVGVDEL